MCVHVLNLVILTVVFVCSSRIFPAVVSKILLGWSPVKKVNNQTGEQCSSKSLRYLNVSRGCCLNNFFQMGCMRTCRGESFGCSDFGACCVVENWTSAGNGANTSSKLCHCVVIGVLNIYCNYSGAHLKKAAVNAHNQIKKVAHVSRKFAVLIQQSRGCWSVCVRERLRAFRCSKP